MSSVIDNNDGPLGWYELPAERLRFECALMAGRLAQLLRERFVDNPSAVATALAFLDSCYQLEAGDQPLVTWTGSLLERRSEERYHPIDLLGYGLNLDPLELELLILAGLAEQHEGYADIFRTLHPNALPRPSVGLAAQLLCPDAAARETLRQLLESGAAIKGGVYTVEGDGPFHTRQLKPVEALWSVLQGIDAWPATLRPVTSPIVMQGLSEWLDEEEVSLARSGLNNLSTCSIVLTADMAETAFERGAALAVAAGVMPVRIEWPSEPPPGLQGLLQAHTVARGAVAVIRLPEADGPRRVVQTPLVRCPGPVIYCTRSGEVAANNERPLVNIQIEHLSMTSLRRMWHELLPELGDDAASLAARFPLEPAHARQVAEDVNFHLRELGGSVTPEYVAASIRARAATSLGGGVQLIRPSAGWGQLVLPPGHLLQLREAVSRLHLQGKVLDDWGFLEGRRGARGVRMLFAGPSGTGKTLSAEVLARELNMDLLVVDLSRVVSKWIGETEKNLAEVFETAERARAVLFFDEADSLFGKRTEVSDAHDRYANMETAYLLSRLERYDGMAILATNLRQNIDPAFTRRLEFIVEYEEPDYEQRLALWRCHLPAGVPLDEDVKLETLASHHSIVGGLIRNAAVAAAFLAAQEDVPISQQHFTRAVRREYEKAGKAYRELPPATANGHH